ncbi:MAG TPA: sugar ABC transporter permease [Solirubrobacterales bacterium]|nr:sugar ABC transporter permease [Solirubrobacterales bacterium]
MMRRQITSRLTPVLLLLPAAALLGWLMVYAAANAVQLSFTAWDGFSSPQSVGLENFSDLLHDKHFKEALLHNLAIVAAMPAWIGIPYGIAWALHSEIWGWKVFRFVFFLPVVLSPVVVGVYYGIVLKPNGPLNSLLESVGLGGLTREWLNDPSLTLPVVIAIIIWSTFGIGVLIFLSGLASLDVEQIDAAKVDGASPWQIQRHVVFWQLLPVIEFWVVLIVIASFTAFFPLIYTLTHGGPGYATYTVDFDLYREAFAGGRLGYASAIGVALVIVMAAIASVLIGLLRRLRTV